ncbi:hypothetical protein M2D63_005620 [Pseudomonas sp. BJa5]|uniref:hypothetical protein n=1 Tax=Pseudomonas sp. BJa5 TaxID=2936270 RepID=UPI002559E244|nr:hypothetical protein [Pseudomonas sp. BGr12]MDL2420591.1 hypothetical protein [Pseudomonas sp. BGr12]
MTTSTSVHSNAFNFLSHLQSGVDPRTGLYTLVMSLPELDCNDRCGPVLPLQLAFNPLNNADSGYGHGWNLQLSQFDPVSGILTLHSGESFKVSGAGSELEVEERKPSSFRFVDLGSECYRITHRSGLVEVLQLGGDSERLALPVQMFSSQGHGISLHYVSFRNTRHLSEIRQADGSVLLKVSRSSTRVEVIVYPDSPSQALYCLQLVGAENRVERLSLPPDNHANWCFSYQNVNDSGLLCLTEVRTPTGVTEYIDYHSQGQLHPVPGRAPLPRVSSHRLVPGNGQTNVETRYSYGSDDHNFLGYGSGLDWRDDALDNLDQVPTSYTYTSTECQMIGSNEGRTITRTFNRFHLLVEERAVQGDRVLRTLSTDLNCMGRAIPQEHSLLTGDVLSERDSNDVEIMTCYDALGRVIEETVAPGTSNETSRHYTYPLASESGQQAGQTATDAKGEQTRTYSDGLYRVIIEERHD